LDDGAVHAVGGLLGEPYGRICETGRNEICQVLAAGERAGDAADVRAALSALDRSEMILRDDIADSDSTTRHEHSVGDSRCAAMPEPMTATTSTIVPMASAISFR
jgi:hypothetical protein